MREGIRCAWEWVVLSDAQLGQYFDRFSVAATAREYISRTRSSPPFRRTGDYALKNVCVQFASRKMGRTIQAESRTAEFAFALEFEYAADVLEFWDQPAPIYIARTLRNGRTRTGLYTPDFLVLTNAGPFIAEVKSGETLPILIQKNPVDWLVVDQTPRYVPAYDAFAKLGLCHRLTPSDSISRIRSANLRLLLQARNCAAAGSYRERIRSAFQSAALLTLAELADEIGVRDLTPLVKLLDEGFVYARLQDDLISEPSTCWVALDESRLAFVPQVLQLRVEGRSPRLPSRTSMARYVDNLERLESGDRGRSARRWILERTRAEANGQNVFEALRPKFENCGNRLPRRLPEDEQFLIEFIDKHYGSVKRLGLRETHRLYEVEAEKFRPNVRPACYATFRARLLRRDKEAIAFARGGRRAANGASLPSNVDRREFKPTRPFELAGLDHYDANIHLLLGEVNGKRFTARPWITMMVDYFTRLILAVWVSFAAPSSRSCAIALRRCVREHQRLPETIIVDRGADFRSLYFMSTLASTAVNLARRPAGNGRYGAEVERPFGLFQTEWLPYLPGNFAHALDARSTSSSHSPAQTAEISIHQFWLSLLDYINQRNSTQTDLVSGSPLAVHTRGLEVFGCSGIPMQETPEFIVDTAVDIREVRFEDSGYVRLDERRRFWCAELVELRGRTKKPEVREEPENPHICYVKVSGRWVTAKGSGAPRFQTLDQVKRLAESLCLCECNSARVQLRKEAQKKFIRSQQALESTHGYSLLGGEGPPKPVPPDAKPTVFDVVRSTELESFSECPSEVLSYVLGKVGK